MSRLERQREERRRQLTFGDGFRIGFGIAFWMFLFMFVLQGLFFAGLAGIALLSGGG